VTQFELSFTLHTGIKFQDESLPPEGILPRTPARVSRCSPRRPCVDEAAPAALWRLRSDDERQDSRGHTFMGATVCREAHRVENVL
jgi:hypothetical protein